MRAASNVALHVAEAEHADPDARKALHGRAAASAGETQAALRVAVAWGYVEPIETEAPAALIGRIVAMLFRLTRA